MRVAAVMMIVLALSVSVVVGGAGAASAEVRLTTPTGDFAIGRDVLHMVDDGQRDPWRPERARELMVSMYYPARSAANHPGTRRGSGCAEGSAG